MGQTRGAKGSEAVPMLTQNGDSGKIWWDGIYKTMKDVRSQLRHRCVMGGQKRGSQSKQLLLKDVLVWPSSLSADPGRTG